MTEYDWTYFIRKMYIRSSMEEVFRMWIDQENITKFWLKEAKYFSSGDGSPRSRPEAGDAYDWTFSSGSKMTGRILAVEDNKMLKFTFGKTYQDSDLEVHVTIRIQQNGQETCVELLQEHIGEDDFGKVHYHLSCQLGWLHALLNLKSVLEMNFDMRETERKRVIETVGISTTRGNLFSI